MDTTDAAAPSAIPLDRLALKPEEAARSIGVSRSLLYLLVATGQIEHFRVGRSGRGVRIPVEGLRRYVEQQTAAQRSTFVSEAK